MRKIKVDDLAVGIRDDSAANKLESLAHKWAHYMDSPADYVNDIILAGRTDGQQLLPYQADILDAVARYDRVGLAAANGVGKDAISAWLIEWFLATHKESQVPCTSGVTRQLKEILFSRVHQYTGQSLNRRSFRLMDMAVRVKGREKTWFAYGFTAKEGSEGQGESKTEGFHADNLMYVITEARAVPGYVWNAVRKACTHRGNKIFAQSVPGVEYGEFYKIFTTQRDSWKSFRFPAAYRVPESEGGGYKPTTPLVSQESLDERIKAWQNDQALIDASIFANFIKQGGDSLIPMHWIKVSVDNAIEPYPNDTVYYGVDVARGGQDKSAICRIKGNKITYLKSFSLDNTMHLVAIIKALYDQEPGRIYVDVIGYGSGVCDRLREMGCNCVGINVHNIARYENKYPDLRTEMWVNIRDFLDPNCREQIQLPDDPELAEELSSVKIKFKQSDGRQIIEQKDDLKKRIGRSPDKADALCLAFFAKRAPIGVEKKKRVEEEPLKPGQIRCPAHWFRTTAGEVSPVMGIPI